MVHAGRETDLLWVSVMARYWSLGVFQVLKRGFEEVARRMWCSSERSQRYVIVSASFTWKKSFEVRTIPETVDSLGHVVPFGGLFSFLLFFLRDLSDNQLEYCFTEPPDI